MPFKNEHSARLRDPRQFKKFARINDRAGKGIDFIFGMKKGSSFIQAIRLDKKLFTVEQAKAWMKESGFPVIKFEPAKEGKSKMRKNPASHSEIILSALSKYGASLNDAGFIEKNGKTTGVKVTVKGKRIRYESERGNLLASGPINGKSVESFVENFWFWKKNPYRKNPADALKPVDLEAWLTASYYEEEKGVKDYMRLLERIKDVPEYSGVRSIVKKIIKDEKKHLKMIARVLGA